MTTHKPQRKASLLEIGAKALLAVALLSSCSPISEQSLYVWAADDSGFFNVLAYNVAGLPAFLNGNGGEGDKTANTKAIGEVFSSVNYDIIHVQEDFNYHAALYETDKHPFRTSTSGGVPFGSGLNTLSRFSFSGDSFERVKWATCSNASQNDCLTPKGFTFMRVQLAEGVYVDLINLHADAGTEDGDEAARSANLKQIADYIATFSAGNAVIVFGDTNSRYSRALDKLVPNLLGPAQLLDAWVLHARNGNLPTPEAPAPVCPQKTTPSDISCEVVDKIFYRSSKAVKLLSRGFFYDTDRFRLSDGSMLSDHHPIRADFSWSLSPLFRQSNLFGGPHGTWFNDLALLPESPTAGMLSAIVLRGGNRLDSVEIRLSSGQSLRHGGTGGTDQALKLRTGESVLSAILCQGKYNNRTRVFYAKLTTNQGATVEAGKSTGDCVTFQAPAGFGVVGFYGRSGDGVDKLGVIYGKAG